MAISTDAQIDGIRPATVRGFSLMKVPLMAELRTRRPCDSHPGEFCYPSDNRSGSSMPLMAAADPYGTPKSGTAHALNRISVTIFLYLNMR